MADMIQFITYFHPQLNEFPWKGRYQAANKKKAFLNILSKFELLIIPS